MRLVRLLFGAALVVGLLPVLASDASARAACDNDLVGDTYIDDSGGGGTPNRARADVITMCVDYSDTFTYSVAMAEPTDPLTDPYWNPGTASGPLMRVWLSNPEPGQLADRYVNIERLDAGLMTVVRLPSDYSVVCSKPARYYDGYLYAEDVALECLGGIPDFLYFSLTMHYDSTTKAGNEQSTLALDDMPNGPSPGDADWFEIPRHATRGVGRLAGPSRIATAAAISQRQFPSSAASVYLARADGIADAVAAGALTDGPILLVPQCGPVPAVVRDEINRLSPQRVVALGGQSAVCDATLAEASGGRSTSRLAGADRIQTSAAIARAAFPNRAPVVYLARADVLVDAVASGTLNDGPVVLTPSCGAVPAAVRDVMTDLAPDSVVALGGPAAICDQMLRDAAGGRPTQRVSGADRFATAIAISQRRWGATAPAVYLTRADVLSDAVAAGVLADGPVLLVQTCGPIRAEVDGEIARLDPPEVFALGGGAAVCDLTLKIAATAGVPYPEGGST